MEIRKIIQRKIERRERGLDLQADVNAVIAANVGEEGQSTHVASTRSATASSGSPGRTGKATPRRRADG